MAYTLEQIEWLHDHGKMPDWAYYQQNGKSATMNLYEQTKKFKERVLKEEQERQEEAKRKAEEMKLEKEIEKKLEKQIETQLEEAVQKALENLLKDLGK